MKKELKKADEWTNNWFNFCGILFAMTIGFIWINSIIVSATSVAIAIILWFGIFKFICKKANILPQ